MWPKVRFTRAGVVETEVTLEPGDYRLGRASDNDIVLRDPDKTLSRHHAELRFDGTQWFYLDLNSANGSWVDGAQVTRQALDRDLTILLGDYELRCLREPRKGEETSPDVDATRMIPVGNLQDLAGVAIASGRGRDTAIIGKAVPVAAGTEDARKAAAPAVAKAGWSPLRRILIFGWLAVFGIFAVMIAAMLRPGPASNASEATAESTTASAAPAATAATPASAETALAPPATPQAGSPAGAQATSAGAPAGATPIAAAGTPAPTSASVPQPAAPTQPPAAATAPQPQSMSSPPLAKSAAAPTAPGQEPTARAMSAPGTAPRGAASTLPPGWVPATGATAAPPPARRPARAEADADATSLPAQPGESPAALKSRRDRVRVRYDMALQRLAGSQFGEAYTLLGEVAAEAPGFRDVAARFAEAQGGLRQQFKQAADAAAKHEQAAEWSDALKSYEALRPYASALPELEPAVARTRARMHEAGAEALTKARQFDSRGRMPEAIAWYQRAVAWLPADHPGLEPARQRLAQLGGRP